MSQRTDCHRPGAIIPADYTYLFSYAAPDRWWSVNWHINNERLNDGPHSARALLGTGQLFRESLRNCHSCGAHFRYGDIWRHNPTGKLVAFGHICSEKYGCLADRSDYERIKAAEMIKADKARKAAEAEERRRSTLTDHDGLFDALNTDHHIVRDIKSRFDRHGYLSDAQRNLVFKLYNEDQKRKSESVDHRNVPEGKQTVTGTVISAKWKDGPYGMQAKMTVKVTTDDGGFFLVYSTVPAAIANAFEENLSELSGRTVTFTGTLSRSDRDRHFGFASRPSKARLHAEETALTAV